MHCTKHSNPRIQKTGTGLEHKRDNPAERQINMDKNKQIQGLASVIATNPARAEFASSLLAALVKGSASEKQVEWIDRLIDEAQNPAPVVGDLAALIEAFRASKDRFPKIRGTVEGIEWTISYTPRDSAKAKPENCDTCNVASGKYGSPDNKFAGRILADGSFKSGRDLTPAVAAWIASVAENPQPKGK